MMEKKGFEILFQDGKAKGRVKGSKYDGIVLKVREHDLYRLTAKAEKVQVQV